jgi:hypothetical protein
MSGKNRKKIEISIDSNRDGSLRIEDLKLVSETYNLLSKRYDLSCDEFEQILKRKYDDIVIPVSIFNNKTGSLETVVKYLKENLRIRLIDISKILGRSYSTIIVSYGKSTKKYPKRFIVLDSRYHVPISIIQRSKLSILESIVVHLKENYNLKFSEIARLLQRDQRTVWTAYSRAGKKSK